MLPKLYVSEREFSSSVLLFRHPIVSNSHATISNYCSISASIQQQRFNNSAFVHSLRLLSILLSDEMPNGGRLARWRLVVLLLRS